MRLRDFLAPEWTLVPLEATTLQDAAAQLLERLLPAHGVLDGTKLRARVSATKSEDVVARIELHCEVTLLPILSVNGLLVRAQ